MYITPEPEIAKAAQAAGVDWIFVDLETLGKQDRQGHLDTVISRHTIDDVKAVRSVLSNSQLLVRTNPLHDGSVSEIDSVIAAGADIVMLPFFTTADEVNKFLSIVDGRAQTCLLLETPEAVDNLADVVELSGIDYVHIGLNDLHLGYDLDFMFEPLINGTVDHIASMLRQSGV
ncbi:MAG: aldolase/citrate lyase family protein [Yaniella sp.]|nr:aldolase/citrate lyase family protein [Yaniella sp.]